MDESAVFRAHYSTAAKLYDAGDGQGGIDA
jgi:hypothetical protein